MKEFIIVTLALLLQGCTHYGTYLHDRGEMCSDCKLPLIEKCGQIGRDGRYPCKCVSCGNVERYGKGKPPVPYMAYPKGIKTVPKDGFNK